MKRSFEIDPALTESTKVLPNLLAGKDPNPVPLVGAKVSDVFELAIAIGKAIPESDLDRMPRDGAENHDRYIELHSCTQMEIIEQTNELFCRSGEKLSVAR